MAQEFTPQIVGRIVWGHPNEGEHQKDPRTKQKKLKDGQPITQWACGVAFPKQAFDQHIRPWLEAEARTGFPHGAPPRFSWKFKDGDGIDDKGKPFNTREGYAGCYVLTVSSTAFAPPVVQRQPDGSFRQMEPKEIKCGDYVVLSLSVKVNVPPAGSTDTPSIYVNPQGYQFVGYGQEILRSAFDADTAFGNTTYALPPGASASPQVPAATGGAPSYAPAPAAPGYAPPAHANPYAAAPPPVHPAPAHDFVRNAGQPPAAPGYAPAPPPPAPPVMAAPFPPPGWTAHPSAPGYFYQGQQVISEADLRSRSAVPGLPPGR